MKKSNCLFEYVKAKMRNPSIKALYIPAFLNEVRCFHIMWTDGVNEYDFHHFGPLPWYEWMWHTGIVRTLEKGAYSRLMKFSVNKKYGKEN